MSSTTAPAPPSQQKAVKARPVRDDETESARLCDKWVHNALTKNKSIQYLMQTLLDLGCQPPNGRFIECRQCVQPAAGGFGLVKESRTATETKTTTTTTINTKDQCQRTQQDLREQLERAQAGKSTLTLQPEIYLCQQYMEDELHTHKTLAHELIHAIDVCRTRMDPLHNCLHLACTEVRAENLSGECSLLKELPHIWKKGRYAGHGRDCVRRRALLSVRAHPGCKDRAEDYVDAVLPRCFDDVYPFDKHPNLR